MSIFQPPPRFFLPSFPHSPDSASPLLSPRHARSPQSPHPLVPAPPPSSSSLPSASLPSPIYPVILATALIVLCLTSAVLLSLINQQCNDIALFSPIGPADDSLQQRPLVPQPASLTSTGPALPAAEEERDEGKRKGRDRERGKDKHDKQPKQERRHHSREHSQDKQQREGVRGAAAQEPATAALPSPSSSTGGWAGAALDCVGICCMSFPSRVLLILAFLCNAVLISFLLCAEQPSGQGEGRSLLPLALPSVSSSAVHRCASYLLLAVVHFLLTGAVVLLLVNQQSHVTNFPSFHSSLLFSSYILLLFTSFCIEALSLLSAITPPTVSSPPPAPLSLSFLPPDPDTERLLFHSLPTDPVHSLSSTAFAYLPSYIIPCVGDDHCDCLLQRGDESHVCKEMEEGRRRKKRRKRRIGGGGGERRRSEERGEVRKKREEEGVVVQEEAVVDAEVDEEEEEVPSPLDSDEEWESERGRVETFDFARGLVVSMTTPSYSPRYGAMSTLAALGSPLSGGGDRPSLLSSSMPNLPLLSLTSSQSDGRSLYLPSSSSSSSSSSPSLLPSATTPLLPLPSLPSSCTCVCAICLERFTAHSVIKLIACEHRFHISCLRPWAARRTTCPLCRAPLTAKAEGDERRWGRGGIGRSVSFSG